MPSNVLPIWLATAAPASVEVLGELNATPTTSSLLPSPDGGNTMNIAYHLLLGACKWGVESFVSALLRLPGANGLLSMRTLDGRLPEDIAEANNHKCLAEHLMNLRTM